LITDTSGRYLYDYNEKSDVWSLGVILYELCFSESPFRNVNSTEDLEREIIGFRLLSLSLFRSLSLRFRSSPSPTAHWRR
jgi:serine/threonine protein kinase